MGEDFIVEWQVTDGLRWPVELVSVRLRGRKAGLYRVKQVRRDGLVLSQGAISFPVGTQLEIDEFQRLVPHGGQHLRVVANDQQGLSLAW